MTAPSRAMSNIATPKVVVLPVPAGRALLTKLEITCPWPSNVPLKQE